MAMSVKQYVTENIDKALNSGWIKVYYQPVIRSLTEQLCGAESLARWIDPEMGFLPPDKFIGTLEKTRQIHKLDLFMVEQVCKDISERLKKNLPTVPVSVNFSRQDFEEVDMLATVEGLVKKYDVPRDYLHIEVTESMIVSDADLMEKMIDSFRDAGYEVWMDDFGSGYSSLNLLKDYNFDTIKLDMEFLRKFSDKSKAIMTSTITMAKDIDVMTLAEGVETMEQIDFLRKIGCGKLQGYYYGKPLPIDEFFEHIEKQNIKIEERKWRHFYDVASKAARATDEPLEIIEDDGKEFKTLFMNEPYMGQIFENTETLKVTDERIYHTASPLIKKYREFANTLETSRNVETFYYTVRGNIYRFVAQAIAENEGKYIIKGSIHNISTDNSVRVQHSVENRLKELNHLFDNILQVNPDADTAIPLLGMTRFQFKIDGTSKLSDALSNLKAEAVATADRERFTVFSDMSTMRQRIEDSKNGYVEAFFRMKQKDGTFKWTSNLVMIIPGTGGKEFLVCIRVVPDNIKEILGDTGEMFRFEDFGLSDEGTEVYGKLFMNFIANSSVKFFWKDDKRNFVGASKAFLEFFGIESLESIKGKPSEKQSWSVDKKRSIQEDTEILTKGAKIENAPSQYIINGVMHNTICNKAPIYKDGKIIGIMGYLVDVGEELKRLDSFYQLDKTDKVTGLTTIRSLLNTLVDYMIQYEQTGADYGVIVLRNDNFQRIVASYGEEFGNKLLKVIADAIVKAVGSNCAVSRVRHSDFALIAHASAVEELQLISSSLKKSIEAIHMIDGNSVTLKIQTAYALRSEEGVDDEGIYYTAFKRL